MLWDVLMDGPMLDPVSAAVVLAQCARWYGSSSCAGVLGRRTPEGRLRLRLRLELLGADAETDGRGLPDGLADDVAEQVRALGGTLVDARPAEVQDDSDPWAECWYLFDVNRKTAAGGADPGTVIATIAAAAGLAPEAVTAGADGAVTVRGTPVRLRRLVDALALAGLTAEVRAGGDGPEVVIARPA